MMAAALREELPSYASRVFSSAAWVEAEYHKTSEILQPVALGAAAPMNNYLR